MSATFVSSNLWLGSPTESVILFLKAEALLSEFPSPVQALQFLPSLACRALDLGIGISPTVKWSETNSRERGKGSSTEISCEGNRPVIFPPWRVGSRARHFSFTVIKHAVIINVICYNRNVRGSFGVDFSWLQAPYFQWNFKTFAMKMGNAKWYFSLLEITHIY